MSTDSNTNGFTAPLQRADEAQNLLAAIQGLVTSFVRAADEAALKYETGESSGLVIDGKCNEPINRAANVLLDSHPPRNLQQILNFTLPETGVGKQGFIHLATQILRYSVNTWSQGFLDKLYASTTPIGLASELLLSALNTNVHVYQVSPTLTIIEKETCGALAGLFGLKGQYAGGVSQPGGSAANLSSLVIARNVLFPETKREGLGGRRHVMFASRHAHYSLEKAAQLCGFGSNAVKSVDVDEQGRMRVDLLEDGIKNAREKEEEPFYVCATSGTTVLGSFDPVEEISGVCKREGLWLHVDASWGGGMAFSSTQRHKLRGTERADSIAICAHKMLGVPLTCSFLLGKDLREFRKGMTLPAGYLFHNDDGDEKCWDLADLTPQCGRRGDSLKLAMAWIYYGTAGLGAYVDNGFDMAAHLASLVQNNPRFELVSSNPPPCLQVCFYYRKTADRERNGEITERIAKKLIGREFMVDFAPGKEGKFLRVVMNGQTKRETVDGLVKAIEEVGEEVCQER